MKKTTFKISLLSLFFIFLSNSSFAQLSNFTFNVSSTNESCLGNGSLTFTVANTTPGATIDYAIYLLPNVTTALITVTTTSYSGLNSGNYLVVATQSLNGNQSTKSQNVTILNTVQTLSYTISSTKVRCGNDGILAVNVTSGNPVSYQIISGPVTVAPQPSNTFTGLPIGVYQIRVFDVCGEALVQTFTLEQVPISLIIEPVTFPGIELPSCNTISVSNFVGVLSGFVIAYPLSLQYTIFSPSGGTIIQNSTLTNGNFAVTNIPFFYNQSYFYNLKITDACGTIYTSNNNIINKKLEIDTSIIRFNCTDIALKIIPVNFVSPYTISFLTFPTAFNPQTFNVNHPGPFNSDFEIYGTVGASFPTGFYSIQLTDFCGRTIIKNLNVNFPNANPIASGSNNGCGRVSISISFVQLVSVVIVNAPSAYGATLPQNVSEYINLQGNLFTMSGLPVGTYTFQVTDSCGVITTVFITVLPYAPIPLNVLQRPGCEIGNGSVTISSTEGITSASLIAAPISYTGVLPLNLDSNIVDTEIDNFSFGTVPQGIYTFAMTNSCGSVRTTNVSVTGYQIISNSKTITENCGSFNLLLQHNSNGNFLQSFWLQKFNSATNAWTHPATGIIYPEGTDPNTTNSLFLQNNINNLNLAFTGQFRIIKKFNTINTDGSLNSCIAIIDSFEFLGGPKINNINAILCSANNNEVSILATGIAPLTYSIVAINNVILPIPINNGTSNLFSGLASAIYKFRVSDVCGNIVNVDYDISTIAPLAIQATNLCSGQAASLSVTAYSYLTYEWWKDNNISTILSTSSTLNFNPFNAATDFGVYHVRISNPSLSASCVNTILDYAISPNVANPNAGLDTTITYCGNQGIVDLTTLISGTFDNGGTWQEITNSGTLTNNLWNSNTVNSGTFKFRYTVTAACASPDDSVLTIIINEIPEVPIATADAITCENQDLNLYASSVANASYQWFGPNGFTSNEQNPILPNASILNNGVYTVKTIKNNCISLDATVTIAIKSVPAFTLNSICNENQFTIIANSVNDSFDQNTVSYSWTGPNNFISFENPMVLTGKVRGIYYLTITDVTGCFKTNQIEVLKTLCIVPKGVSPNGDGNNDTFNLLGYEVDNLQIFNRYGRVIYEKENYQNEWNGQDYNNNLLPSATYYYLLKLKSGETESGWVYLQRN